jgi:NADPH:quinone reductase-like Zn-dependent oxidoreductase
LFVLPDGDELGALARLAETGELRVNLAQTLPLAEAAHAQELIEGGHVRGKLALQVS